MSQIDSSLVSVLCPFVPRVHLRLGIGNGKGSRLVTIWRLLVSRLELYECSVLICQFVSGHGGWSLSSPETMVVIGMDFKLVTAVGSLCYHWRRCEDVDVGPCQDMVCMF